MDFSYERYGSYASIISAYKSKFAINVILKNH